MKHLAARVANAVGLPETDTTEPPALPATPSDTEPLLTGANAPSPPTTPTPDATQPNDANGSEPTSNVSGGESQTSNSSDQPSKPSKPVWRKPHDAKAFAAQVNRVATMLLNGEIELDTARAYSNLGRTMAQVLSAEVYRARYMKEMPDLTLEEPPDAQ